MSQLAPFKGRRGTRFDTRSENRRRPPSEHKTGLAMRLYHSAYALALVAILSGCATAPHYIDNAVFLGERTVDRQTDRDAIRVANRVGAFRSIQFAVRRNDVNIRSMRIYFENGSHQQIRFRRPFRAGTKSRPIDLDGGKRRIDRVEFVYDTRNRYGGRGVVALYGLK